MPGLVLITLAVVVVAGLIGATTWWLTRRHPSGSFAVTVAGRSVAAGTLAGAAMIPPGLLLNANGYSVNVYGDLLLRKVLGQVVPSAVAVEHFAISVALAVPFVAATVWRPGRQPLPGRRLGLGVGYGALAWLLVNSFALPLAFGRPSPWALGFNAIWPSLLIHVVYGLTLGAVVAREERTPRSSLPQPDPHTASPQQ